MEEFIRFLTEYAGLFEQMEEKQATKLGLLMTKELDKLEQAIMMQQAMDKQVETMEVKRAGILVSMGLEGKSLKEVAALCDEDQKGRLMELYRRLDQSIGNIRFFNQKAEGLARAELDTMGIDARLAENPTGIYGPLGKKKGHKFEKKA